LFSRVKRKSEHRKPKQNQQEQIRNAKTSIVLRLCLRTDQPLAETSTQSDGTTPVIPGEREGSFSPGVHPELGRRDRNDNARPLRLRQSQPCFPPLREINFESKSANSEFRNPKCQSRPYLFLPVLHAWRYRNTLLI
jgi:hypothetical protein